MRQKLGCLKSYVNLGLNLEESAGIIKFATEEMRYNTDLYYEIAGLSLLKMFKRVERDISKDVIINV